MKNDRKSRNNSPKRNIVVAPIKISALALQKLNQMDKLSLGEERGLTPQSAN